MKAHGIRTISMAFGGNGSIVRHRPLGDRQMWVYIFVTDAPVLSELRAINICGQVMALGPQYISFVDGGDGSDS